MGIFLTLRKDRALLQECDFPCSHVGLLGEGAEGGVELGLGGFPLILGFF